MFRSSSSFSKNKLQFNSLMKRTDEILSKFQKSPSTGRIKSFSTIKNEVIFNEESLKHLACPFTKQPLRYDKEKKELISEELNIAFPIIDGIPNFNPSAARKLTQNPLGPTKMK